MKKIFFLISFLFNSPIFALMQINPQMTLQPLCFQDIRTCEMAAQVLTLPPFGNFRITSKCRDKNPAEINAKVCYNFKGLLGVDAFIDLPMKGQFQWRNQCYDNINICNQAAQIWNQLQHPLISFHAECGNFIRNMWKMDDAKMKAEGIYFCAGRNIFELRVRAMRER